jgi:hypothetical protein
MILASAPICPSRPIIMLAIQPAAAPKMIHKTKLTNIFASFANINLQILSEIK